MAGVEQSSVRDLQPQSVWDEISKDNEALFIDVRTQWEWNFVGTPDLSGIGKDPALIEWRQAPSMQVNPGFLDTLRAAAGTAVPGKMYFICRSGGRSREAAQYVQDSLSQQGLDVECINVAEGFEGDLNGDAHRGTTNGWKARGLPWRQT